jgi:tetraacyldisaccharide 4'-kinase
MKWLNHIWYNPNSLLAKTLQPFSYLYRSIAAINSDLYSMGIKKTSHFPVPIVVVGNLTVGGTGKTPLVIALANLLRENGYKPGIVSRGYGGRAEYYPQWVDNDSDPHVVGDEPILMAQTTKCPVVVDPKRVRAVQRLLEHTDCNVIISDDGLQHHALARDIEIAVVDGERRFGNGFCLPAGPLREPIDRLQRVDFVIVNGEPHANEFEMSLQAEPIYNLSQPDLILDTFTVKQPVHAVAGIANPTRFFNQLRKMGLSIIEHAFPDHYYFQVNDFNFLSAKEFAIMTEKDAVKCQSFADERFWCLPVRAICDNDFVMQFLDKIKPICCK